jgi:single-strand DNA-binding protein
MGSRSLNKAMIIGNLGAEPKLAATNTGVPVCTFNVATNRSWLPKGATGRREETQWHHVVAFNKLAEICHQILTKSTKVFVSGRVQNRELVNAEGEKFRKTEIVARNVIALDKRKDSPAAVE